MEIKKRRKGSIFRKLIVSYIIFSLFAILIVVGVAIVWVLLATGIGEQSGFPGISLGENGEILNMEGVQNLGGWVEELDENYRVKALYGEKQTDGMQYTPEDLLAWTDQGVENRDFYLYWQKKESGLYLIFYPAQAYTVTYSFDVGEIFHFSTTIGMWAWIMMVVLLSADIFFVSFYVLRKIHRPLQNLVMGMKRVEQGEERVELSMQTEKEFVEIQEAFNHMTEELHAQKAENEKMSKNRRKMLLELSHDIKTPIATIKSYAFALQEGIVPKAQLEQYYRTIALKADRVDTMAADLFTMLKMESAEYMLEFQKIDLAELTRRIVAEYYEEVTGAGFEFALRIPEHAVFVNADEKLLTRVVSNLLTNAKKYNRTGKRIEIGLEERGEEVHLWVKDDGKPIEPELQDTMFMAFVRGESTRSTKGGTGLGLAIAKAVMEKHGGDIFYQEEEGNRFEIIFFRADFARKQGWIRSTGKEKIQRGKSIMQLRIKKIQKQFDKKTVLNRTSFDFQEGLIYSVLGRNGAGKTTLFRCISGDLFFEEGEVVLEENGVSRPLTYEDVGIVSASPVLPDFLTGYEFIHFFVKLNQEEDLSGGIDSYFDLVRIEEEDRHKLIRNYSYGMKNKLQLMCCLIRNPKVILLDEPLSSFDIIVSHDIKEMLLGMKEGHIILMATHIMQLAQDMSDEIVLLREGALEAAKECDLHGADFENYIIQALQEKTKTSGTDTSEADVSRTEEQSSKGKRWRK